MRSWRPDAPVASRLYRQAKAERWGVALESFLAALELSTRKAFGADAPEAGELERYLSSLHLEDLALACACAAGKEAAWESFVREHRPGLYRAADAIDPGGGARDLADSLYAELFGLSERDGERRSHFHYYHGRSSLGTWLRAVMAQRHVDRIRSVSRLEPLPSDEAPGAIASAAETADPNWPRSVALIGRAVMRAVAALSPRDRLRLNCYYAQDLTLAQIGRALGEHEATVSRQLARARRAIREDVERQLREGQRMSEAEITECFRSVADNTGSLDVAELLGTGQPRKEAAPQRSIEEGSSARTG